jgi:NAD(P)-dependent dehydrogenase (short-subunit alcohol dehydrogenase family)
MANRRAVLITGGARRIGAAIARAFGEAGWHVVIHHGNSHEEADALARSLPSAEPVSFALDDPESAAEEIATIAARLDDWRVLVNSAATFSLDTADRLDTETFDRTMRVNAATPARMTQAFLGHAQAASGRRAIFLTDQKLANPNPDFFSYTMSKHALAAAVPMLAMAATNPLDRVYAIAPGAILASHDQTDEEAEASHRLNLLERRTGADEIAATALFLADGWLASGETIFVDSGQHLLAQPRDVLFLARQ